MSCCVFGSGRNPLGQMLLVVCDFSPQYYEFNPAAIGETVNSSVYFKIMFVFNADKLTGSWPYHPNACNHFPVEGGLWWHLINPVLIPLKTGWFPLTNGTSHPQRGRWKKTPWLLLGRVNEASAKLSPCVSWHQQQPVVLMGSRLRSHLLETSRWSDVTICEIFPQKHVLTFSGFYWCNHSKRYVSTIILKCVPSCRHKKTNNFWLISDPYLCLNPQSYDITFTIQILGQ